MFTSPNNPETHPNGSPGRRRSLPFESSIWATEPQNQRHFSLSSNLQMLDESVSTSTETSPAQNPVMSPRVQTLGESPVLNTQTLYLGDESLNAYDYHNTHREAMLARASEEFRVNNQPNIGFMGPPAGQLPVSHFLQSFHPMSPGSHVPELQPFGYFANGLGHHLAYSGQPPITLMAFPNYTNDKVRNYSTPSSSQGNHAYWIGSSDQYTQQPLNPSFRTTLSQTGRISPSHFVDPRLQIRVPSQDQTVFHDLPSMRRHSLDDPSRLNFPRAVPHGAKPQERKHDDTSREITHLNPKIDEYFTEDPHQRLVITLEYLQKRMVQEGTVLATQASFPKFSLEELLHDKQLVIVAFKAGRLDVFTYSRRESRLKLIKHGDLVIVEADRGRDLGKVVKIGISVKEAKVLKMLQSLEQQAALSERSIHEMSLSSLCQSGGRNSPSSVGCTDNAAIQSGSLNLHCPKAILQSALENETLQLLSKRQDEEKACRLGLAKMSSMANSTDGDSTGMSHGKQMELIDAEYQFDRKKLIFYYSANRRIDFRELVRELFRVYKTRIWMCAVSGIPYTANHLRRRSRFSRDLLEDDSQAREERKGSATLLPSTTVHFGWSALDAPNNAADVPLMVANTQHWESEVPRKFQNSSSLYENLEARESGEAFVLKSLVESINR